jgi:hypothetical protein
MSLFWMVAIAIAVLTCAQKLLPAKAVIDVALALITPSLFPGLTPPVM